MKIIRSALACALMMACSLPVLAAANPAVCYGTLDGVCKAPDLHVDAAAVIQLPGDLYADTTQDPVTLRVALRSGAWAIPPTPVDATVIASTPNFFAASGAGPFAVTGLAVSADVTPGDDIVADVQLVNPNTSTVLFDAPLTLARIRGVTDLEVLTLNPAGNPNQATFLRVSNVSPTVATLRLLPTDDSGHTGSEANIVIDPGASVQVSSEDLERGNASKGVFGGFGVGTGKWRVHVIADQKVRVQALVRSADGSLSDISSSIVN